MSSWPDLVTPAPSAQIERDSEGGPVFFWREVFSTHGRRSFHGVYNWSALPLVMNRQ